MKAHAAELHSLAVEEESFVGIEADLAEAEACEDLISLPSVTISEFTDKRVEIRVVCGPALRDLRYFLSADI